MNMSMLWIDRIKRGISEIPWNGRKSCLNVRSLGIPTPKKRYCKLVQNTSRNTLEIEREKEVNKEEETIIIHSIKKKMNTCWDVVHIKTNIDLEKYFENVLIKNF